MVGTLKVDGGGLVVSTSVIRTPFVYKSIKLPRTTIPNRLVELFCQLKDLSLVHG